MPIVIHAFIFIVYTDVKTVVIENVAREMQRIGNVVDVTHIHGIELSVALQIIFNGFGDLVAFAIESNGNRLVTGAIVFALFFDFR